MLCIFTGVLAAGCAEPQAQLTNETQTQTYSNQTYGYSLEHDPDVMDITDDTIEGGTAGSPGYFFHNDGHAAVGVWENPNNLTAREWLDDQYAEYSGGWNWDFAETVVNGMQAYSATRSDGCYINWVIVPHQSDFVTIRAEYCGDDQQEFQQQFNALVQTLSFN